jgi:hypothetical protein
MEAEDKQQRRMYICRKDSQCCYRTAEPKGTHIRKDGRKKGNK